MLALFMAAIVYIYLEFFYSEIIVYEPEESPKEVTSVFGVVVQKEQKQNSLGEVYTVLYLVPGKKLKGNFKYIECYLSADSYEPSIGETILIAGKTVTFSAPGNPGEFDSRCYYSTLKIAYRLKNASVKKADGKTDYFKEGLYDIKFIFEKNLDKCMPEEDASIMKAMLLGDKSFMDEEIKDLYKDSGIMHILAVSGLHISIIGMGIYRLLKKVRLPEVFIVAVCIVIMFSYGAMCGMNTSAFRAIMMFTLRLMAPVFGRTYDIYTGLSFAFILLLPDQPLYLYNSGFLFSFGAIVGITLLKPSLRPFFLNCRNYDMKFADEKKDKNLLSDVLRKSLDSVITCISIMIITLPVYASFYYTYPLGSIILNLLVLPLMGVLMSAGVICMSMGTVGIIGKSLGAFVHIILLFYKLSCDVTKFSGRLTWYMGHSSKIQVFIYAIMIAAFISGTYYIGVYISGKRISQNKLLKLDVLKYLFIVIAVFVLTFRILPELEINMIDVGQGDGILISSGRNNILIDGGSTSKKKVGKYQMIPFFKYKGVGTLDVVVLTHEDTDHISGILDILDDMEDGGIFIKKMILPEVDRSCRGDNYRRLQDRAGELGIPVFYINSGESFRVGEIEFFCLNPDLNMIVDGANAYSTVLFMKYNDFKALFTGDVEKNGQENIKEIMKQRPEIFDNLTLLKVAHHGSMYTTDMDFLNMINPKIALISCGLENSYGHPHKELLERLDIIGAKTYRTDICGEIGVELHKGRISVHKFR
ncbi:MAG: DNA internalization-related competence protein ComEC/Rec2 [Butyrivibrio sp.]|uniref:DNA internalization-related competence protein ComEC/Rec2 n=1 Tax=Butyrivibrio sp. TaxID=28121 RepID=UPI001B1F2301|nr:DNA internalization-related competence protein ComEC/Rec2 [Butyrivibrio sp.]MBO6240249.1 DNA internalization-related competence protein ComEC/Rec2 [Butyrivibrio sp.]